MNIAKKWVNITQQFNLQKEQIIWCCEQISYTQKNNFTWRKCIYIVKKVWSSTKHGRKKGNILVYMEKKGIYEKREEIYKERK